MAALSISRARFRRESAMNGRLFPAFASTQTASYAGCVGSHSAFRLCRIFSVFLGGLSLSLSLSLSHTHTHTYDVQLKKWH